MATATKERKTRSKKSTKQITHIGVLLDESGSMGGNRQSVIEGVNEFVGNLRGDVDDKDVRLTLGTFDQQGGKDILRVPIDGIPINDTQELGHEDYKPFGGTPLNDATLQMLSRLDKKAKKSDKVMLVIFTDGHENASEADTETVRKAIVKKEKAGWQFIYLGANQDSWAEGGARGVSQTSTYNTTASPKGTRSMLQSVSHDASAFANLSQGEYVVANAARHKATGGVLAEDEVSNVMDFVDTDKKE